MIDVDMTVDEALASADELTKGQTFYKGLRGWRVTCAVLAEEVRKLRAGVKCLQHESNIRYESSNKHIETIHSQGVQLSDAEREIVQLRAENSALRESCRSLPW